MRKLNIIIYIFSVLIYLTGCSTSVPKPMINQDTVNPGETITRKGQPMKLTGEPLVIGEALPSSNLVDASSMKTVDLSGQKGHILFLSIVPSLETKVCEAQTHFLGEEGHALDASIKRITISRDTPMAQMRFAKEAKLTDIQYLSDYRTGDFGMKTGLMIDDNRLLARSVVIVDKEGIVRYIQVVPEITNLPDMEKAFKIASDLLK